MWHSAPCRRCNTWCREQLRWPRSGWGHGPSSASWSRSLDHHSSGSIESLIITYHYWLSHPSVFADFLTRSHSSIWENYGNYEKLLRQRRVRSRNPLPVLWLGSYLLIVLLSLSPSPLSKPHLFLCKSIIHLLFSRGRVNLTNGLSLKFPIKVAQSGLTWTGWTPL